MRQADVEQVHQALAPLLRQQNRVLLVAHALAGITAREEGTVSIEDEDDLAAQAVRLAEKALRLMDDNEAMRYYSAPRNAMLFP